MLVFTAQDIQAIPKRNKATTIEVLKEFQQPVNADAHKKLEALGFTPRHIIKVLAGAGPSENLKALINIVTILKDGLKKAGMEQPLSQDVIQLICIFTNNRLRNREARVGDLLSFLDIDKCLEYLINNKSDFMALCQYLLRNSFDGTVSLEFLQQFLEENRKSKSKQVMHPAPLPIVQHDRTALRANPVVKTAMTRLVTKKSAAFATRLAKDSISSKVSETNLKLLSDVGFSIKMINQLRKLKNSSEKLKILCDIIIILEAKHRSRGTQFSWADDVVDAIYGLAKRAYQSTSLIALKELLEEEECLDYLMDNLPILVDLCYHLKVRAIKKPFSEACIVEFIDKHSKKTSVLATREDSESMTSYMRKQPDLSPPEWELLRAKLELLDGKGFTAEMMPSKPKIKTKESLLGIIDRSVKLIELGLLSQPGVTARMIMMVAAHYDSSTVLESLITQESSSTGFSKTELALLNHAGFDISKVVAILGNTSNSMLQALITLCKILEDRFASIDKKFPLPTNIINAIYHLANHFGRTVGIEKLSVLLLVDECSAYLMAHPMDFKTLCNCLKNSSLKIEANLESMLKIIIAEPASTQLAINVREALKKCDSTSVITVGGQKRGREQSKPETHSQSGYAQKRQALDAPKTTPRVFDIATDEDGIPIDLGTDRTHAATDSASMFGVEAALLPHAKLQLARTRSLDSDGDTPFSDQPVGLF